MIETTRDKLLRCGFDFVESNNSYHREKSAHRCFVEGSNTHKAYFNALGGDIWFDDVFHLNQLYNAVFNASENWFDYPLPCPFCGGPTSVLGGGRFIRCQSGDNVFCEYEYSGSRYGKKTLNELISGHNLICLGVSNKKLRSKDDE